MDDEPPEESEPVLWLPEDFAPQLSETEMVADIWASDARQAREAALGAASITALARRRRREQDRDFGALGGPGLDSRLSQSTFLADISETFVPELAQIRCCTEYEAEALAIESIVLTTKLRGTWSALFEGRITVRKMRALVELLAPAKQEAVDAIEAHGAAARGGTDHPPDPRPGPPRTGPARRRGPEPPAPGGAEASRRVARIDRRRDGPPVDRHAGLEVAGVPGRRPSATPNCSAPGATPDRSA